jgi:hypothetical protein
MCAVSVVYDMFNRMPNEWYNRDRLDLFYRLESDARLFDIEAGQPDCEDEEKAKLKERIAELEKQLNDK